jgi:hypothetical protein
MLGYSKGCALPEFYIVNLVLLEASTFPTLGVTKRISSCLCTVADDDVAANLL